jgi:uncharacterized protein
MDQKIIIDTGPLVAFFNRRDEYHHWVLHQLSTLRGTLVTSESVISECLYVLDYSKNAIHALSEMVANNQLIISTTPAPHFSEILKLVEKYQDLPASVADASLLVLYNSLKKDKIFTLDSDFLIYRAWNGEPPALIAPFK